jgi:acetyltransferase
MSVRNLERVLAPDRIAVIGAGPDPASVGGIVLGNVVAGGFAGIVNAVNPAHAAVRGFESYPSVAALPAPPDLAVIATPAATVPALVRDCGEAGVAGVLVLSAGFRESGPEGTALERDLTATAAEFPGLRLIGPNCLGFAVPRLGLNASFAGAGPAAGGVALVSQSGALLTSILDWAAGQEIGFSTVISAGNMADVDFGDLIDHLAEDRFTRSLILYVESVTEPRKFLSAARAFAKTKPIVAYKAGRFAESAAAAVSHTGALAGADDVYDAAFRRAGIVRVREISEVFDAAELLAGRRTPRGDRLAVVTNAGGPGVMAADALLERGGRLAQPDEATLEAIDGALPPGWSHRNPVDVLGDAGPDRYVAAARALLADGGVDALLAVLTPQAMTDPAAIADALVAEAADSRKPLVAAWMGGAAVRAGRERFEAARVPAYPTPERAVGAFMQLVSHARTQEMLHETPRAVPVTFGLERERVHQVLAGVLMDEPGVLSQSRSKALLAAYGIAVTAPRPAASAEEAAAAADALGYPVVLKVRSPEVTHKTDVGGVIAGVGDAASAADAFHRIRAALAEHAPEARFDGVAVEKEVGGPGHELILGARRDATFGAVLMLGAGGVATEVLGDTVLELPPLNERLATGMIDRLRIAPLLRGYRGRPGAGLEQLLEVLIRFSYLVADYPEITEIEVNPLLAGPDEAVALDARIVLDPSGAQRTRGPYPHLAIRPYPDELTTEATMRDGDPVTLRPIKPEDEPLWHEMLAAASAESIHARFRSLFSQTTHRMATRYCYIDYDREMAIVAEIEEPGGRRRLAGVGRVVADADRETAEYAVLVADPWQGRGLSLLLIDRCIEIARGWGVRRLHADTLPDNRRMIATMRSRGFDVRHEDDLVVGTLELSA